MLLNSLTIIQLVDGYQVILFFEIHAKHCNIITLYILGIILRSITPRFDNSYTMGIRTILVTTKEVLVHTSKFLILLMWDGFILNGSIQDTMIYKEGYKSKIMLFHPEKLIMIIILLVFIFPIFYKNSKCLRVPL